MHELEDLIRRQLLARQLKKEFRHVHHAPISDEGAYHSADQVLRWQQDDARARKSVVSQIDQRVKGWSADGSNYDPRKN